MSERYIWPPDLNDLTEADLNTLVLDIRERRSKLTETVKNAKAGINKISDARMRVALDKELLKFTKAMEKADKAISDIEKRLSSITAIRIQMEDASGK